MMILQQALLKIWQGDILNGDDRIAICLLLVMLASLSHLFTMLVTRWGDHHITVKSLFASLLVHTVCLLGLEVFEPLQPSLLAEDAEDNRRYESVTRVLVESEDAIALRESGNTPIPDKPTPPDVELARLPQAARLMETPKALERAREVLDSLKPDAPDVSQIQQPENPESAVPVDSGRKAPRVAAASDPAADIQTMLEQSKADVYVPAAERVPTVRGDPSPSPPSREREMSSGSVAKIDTNVVVEDVAISAAAGTRPDAITIPRTASADDIERRSAPVTGADPLEVAGLNLRTPLQRTMPARSFESRLPRPARSILSPDSGDRPVRQNSLTPQTPIPLTSDYDEVRIGMTSMDLTDALQSAAKLVDSDIHAIRRRDSRSATYQLRNVEQRRDVAAAFGGTEESEAAVELSLKWLSEMQSPDGHWDAESFGAGQVRTDENGVDRRNAGRDADTGVTALVTLAFLGAGYTHEDGRYARNVDRAIDWMIQQQDQDGSLAGTAGHYAAMYCHAMTTYALAEALGMQDGIAPGPIVDPSVFLTGASASVAASGSLLLQQGLGPFALIAASTAGIASQAELTAYGLRKVDDIRLRSALLKAITFTISQQDPDSGGWRYKFGQEGDVSMFGWQMMSLKSADIAGVSINPTVRRRMVEFLNSVRQGEQGGLFGYRRSVVINGQQSEPVTPVMTAEALFCQQMLGYPRDSAASREAVQYLLRNKPRLSQLNLYYWYYGTLAMYQYGGAPWTEWNEIVRDTLIGEQRRDGALAGSWDPNGPWGKYGGRLYSTAIATLTLEVYYRLLPLYRMNDPEAE